jgi:hypothetical protein
VVPYAAYLRVYEPVEFLPAPPGEEVPAIGDAAAPDPQQLTSAEQERSRRAAVLGGAVVAVDAADEAAFVLRRGGRTFVAPADEQVRSWVALGRLADTLSPSAARALTSQLLLDRADEALRAWRHGHPDAVPHVREATWRLPVAWLLLAAPDEQDPYQVGDEMTARYLVPMAQARRRIARALAAARRHFPESDDVAELVDLGRWLEAFHAHSWVELDLAGLGLAVQAADPSEPDRSLQDVQAAVEALRNGRVDEAIERYRDVTVWWGSLALREHAN